MLIGKFFTTRRSVCLSQVVVLSKLMCTDRPGFWYAGFLPHKEFEYLRKYGSLSQTVDLENFDTASRLCYQ